MTSIRKEIAELLPIYSAQFANGQSVVRARDLHAFLEVKYDFNIWIKLQIKLTNLVEHRDYINMQIGEVDYGLSNTFDEYAFTIKIAENIADTSKTVSGMKVLDYLIQDKNNAGTRVHGLKCQVLPLCCTQRDTNINRKTYFSPPIIFAFKSLRTAQDHIQNVAGVVSISGFADAYGIKHKWLFNWLLQNHWIQYMSAIHAYRANPALLREGQLLLRISFTSYAGKNSLRCLERILITAKGALILAEELGLGLAKAE